MSLKHLADILTSAGYSCEEKRGRLYVRKDRQDYGYLVDGDDGSTGTCSGITRRQGTIATLLRDAPRTADPK